MFRQGILSSMLCWTGLFVFGLPVLPVAAGEGQSVLNAAAEEGQYTLIMFYRLQDSQTAAMQRVIDEFTSSREDVRQVAIRVNDPAEGEIVRQFDASRFPLPTVIGVAPNGAITGVHPLTVLPRDLDLAILTPRYSEMVKALQDQQVVVVSLLPQGGGNAPQCVTELLTHADFRGRVTHVSAQADDAAEARFFERMKVRTDTTVPWVLVFAPPGVYVGTYAHDVDPEVMVTALHNSGRCNCERCRQQQQQSRQNQR